jgi:hypothetical protein
MHAIGCLPGNFTTVIESLVMIKAFDVKVYRQMKSVAIMCRNESLFTYDLHRTWYIPRVILYIKWIIIPH